MRIGIARIAQETNTFSPLHTDLETLQAYGVARGQEVLQVKDGTEYVQGFLDVVGDQEVVGLTSVWAMPAGPLTPQALEAILTWFTEDLRNALPLDGVLLSMHGAFASVVEPDVEGAVLTRAREVLGDRVPVGVALDLHANITRKKIQQADFMDGLHTHPHVDSRQTGRRVARVLLAALRGELHPTMSAVKIPMVTPAHTQLTEEYPMKALIEATRLQEQDPRVLLSSVFAVQPWLDVPELGWAAVVVTDGDRPLADRLAREVADLAWSQRHEYVRPCPTYLEALDQAFASPLQPVVIADFADLTTGGGAGDSTWYLRALLLRNPNAPCYLTMVDPEAVQGMARAGEGAVLTLHLGGKRDPVHSSPVEVTGRVWRILPASPERELPPSMGLAGVLEVGNIYVVVSERPGPGSSPVVYTGAGLDPARAKIIVAKSVVDWREGFKEVGRLFLLGEAPGLAPSNLQLLEWKRVTRPLFPLDEHMAWTSAEAVPYRGHEFLCGRGGGA